MSMLVQVALPCFYYGSKRSVVENANRYLFVGQSFVGMSCRAFLPAADLSPSLFPSGSTSPLLHMLREEELRASVSSVNGIRYVRSDVHREEPEPKTASRRSLCR